MAVMRRRSPQGFGDTDTTLSFYFSQEKTVLSCKLTDLVGSKQKIFRSDDDSLAGTIPVHGPQAVEAEDAQVPEFIHDASILDLSNNLSPTLDTPSIIDSFVDVHPFAFGQSVVLSHSALGQPTDIISAAAASAMLGISDVQETFQDLSDMIVNDSVLPMVSGSPEPLLSPADSIYSDMSSLASSASPVPHLSAASTSSETQFFAPDFEVLAVSNVKQENSYVSRRGSATSDVRYNEMRRKNNIASKRSRLSKREKDQQREDELRQLQDENESLRVKAQVLQEQVDKVKKIIMEAVTNRSLANLEARRA